MTCVLLSSPAASVADAGFVAEITDFAVSRKTFVYARHQLSRDVDHMPFCIVFLGNF